MNLAVRPKKRYLKAYTSLMSDWLLRFRSIVQVPWITYAKVYMSSQPEGLSIDTPMVKKIACIGSMLKLQSYLVLHDLTYYGTRDNEAI